MLEQEKSKRQKEQEYAEPTPPSANPFIDANNSENDAQVKHNDLSSTPHSQFKKSFIQSIEERTNQIEEKANYSQDGDYKFAQETEKSILQQKRASQIPLNYLPAPQAQQQYAQQKAHMDQMQERLEQERLAAENARNAHIAQQQYAQQLQNYHQQQYAYQQQQAYAYQQFLMQQQQQEQQQRAYIATVQPHPSQQTEYSEFAQIYNNYVARGMSFDDSYNVDSKLTRKEKKSLKKALYGASTWNSIKRFFKKSFNFKGYASKSEFIKPFLFLSGTMIGSIFFAAIIGGITGLAGLGTLAIMGAAFLNFISIPAMASVTVRRLRDAGISPAMMLFLLFPSFGPLILFIVGASSDTRISARKAQYDDPELVKEKILEIIQQREYEEQQERLNEKRRARKEAQERRDKNLESSDSSINLNDPDLL